MVLFVLSYLGGVLTIISPCILPVLPFVFAQADESFARSGLPMLAGMAATFAGVGTLAALGGAWAVQANQYGRIVAMLVLAAFGVTLIFPVIAERAARPFVAFGSRLSAASDRAAGKKSRAGSSALLGVAVGLLWAPCAGPILGLILTGAAIQGASARSTLFLLAYAMGAATSLAVALLAGGRVFVAMKRSLGAGEWIRRGLGVAVLLGVVAIALDLDRGLLTRLSLGSTTSIEQALLDRAQPKRVAESSAVAGSTLPSEGMMPSLAGASGWLNSPPLTTQALRGKVVLVDFWTYSCINCLRALPYVEAWANKYRAFGLVVIGIHSPEFAFERDPANVRRAVQQLGVTYPIALDSGLMIWQAFNNEYWPAHYFIDAEGRIRHHHFGEGQYAESERVLQALLTEAGIRDVPGGIVAPSARGGEAGGDNVDMKSPETYIGYERAEHFVSGDVAHDRTRVYSVPNALALNQWGLSGNWQIGAEAARLSRAGGRIVFRFHARDLHLVLGPGADHTPIRFRVTIDGAAPGGAHGTDVDSAGNGVVIEQRLYQLVRQAGIVTDHTFAIEFLDAEVRAFSFTFG